MGAIPLTPSQVARQSFRFALPPSLGAEEAKGRARAIERFLTGFRGGAVEVVIASNYEALAKDLLAGRIDAAWAPPFVCARVEAMGIRVLVRGVRKGVSSYRAALVCRAGERFTLERLAGASALWTDRDSVGGYLLPIAFLRSRGVDPQKTFFAQKFAGSYQAALEGVLSGEADVTSVFAPAARAGTPDVTGADEVIPGASRQLTVLGFTDEAPNDGVAVAIGTPPDVVDGLEKALLDLASTPEGRSVLRAFNAERFEPAPRMGYRALYRVALASL